jgi:hypothetical protein
MLENISDRTEVRRVLIGLLLDSIYLGTAALISQANDFGLKSIGLIVSVCVGEYVLLNAGVVIIFNRGPWDVFFWRISPLSQFLKSSARFAAQVLLFDLNRFTRYLFATLFAPKSRYLSVYLKLRHILYRTNSLNNTAHVRNMSPDVYQELRKEKTIRLLQVLQGWPSQKLECKFKLIQLGGSDSYEAVSYVWGDPSATRSIVVDGRHLPITKSAYDIIHRRRSALVDQLIWIDQICINQNNAKEKASQVQMMGQIYKEAARVTAYLGNSENAHLVQLLFSELYFMKQGLGMSPEKMAAVSFTLSKSQRPLWAALVEFFRSPWFRRVWIVSNFQSAKYHFSAIR